MKKWERADIVNIGFGETEHEWSFNWSGDGGYLGDGMVSGWFGSRSCNPTPVCPQPNNNAQGNS